MSLLVRKAFFQSLKGSFEGLLKTSITLYNLIKLVGTTTLVGGGW